MAVFNSVAYWIGKRKSQLKKFLEYEETHDENGYRKLKLNYYSGDVKTHFDKIFKQYQENGVLKKFVIEMIAEQGFIKKDVERQLKGTAPMLAVEFIEYTKAVGADMNGDLKKKLYSFEDNKDRIIIRRNVYPRFYINMSKDDHTDYECDLSVIRKDSFKEQKVWKLFKKALEAYFGSPSGVFYNRRQFYLDFKKKLYSGEFNNEITRV